MKPQDLTQHRLHNQQIAAPSKTVAEAVAALGAVQAQDYPGSLWSIGLRVAGGTEASVEQAIAARSIVRTWPMRGTLHFVSAQDVRWMLELLTPRVVSRMASRHRQLGLTDDDFKRARTLFTKSLQGGKQLTRDAMYEALESAGISAEGQRGIHILCKLAQEGLLCFAARQGKQFTFALLDEWVPNARRLPRDEALAELARRYFTGHGPATLPDFMWWAGLTSADAKQALALAGARLTKLSVEGQDYWMGAQATGNHPSADGVYLLPGFDEYLIAYKDRTAALAREHADRIIPGGNGMFLATIVSKGRVVGTWKRTLKSKSVDVMPSPFAKLSKAELRAIEGQAERYGHYLGLEARLVT